MRLLFPGVLLLALLNTATTCRLGLGEHARTPVLFAPLPDVRTELLAIVRKEGFTLEEGFARDTSLRTEWKTRMRPHWREGYRERLSIDLWEEGGGVVASINATREVNEDSTRPLDPSSAEWISSENDTDLQERIVLLLRMKFTDWKKEP